MRHCTFLPILTLILTLRLPAIESWTKINFTGGHLITMQSFNGQPEVILSVVKGHGLYRSSDRAGNWRQICDQVIYDLSISRDDIAYYAGEQGLYVSTDLGQSWRQLLDHLTWQVVADRNGIVVADTMSHKKLYGALPAAWIISYDSGQSWSLWPNTESLFYSYCDKRGSILFHNNGRVYRTEGHNIYSSAKDDWSQWSFLGQTDPFDPAHLFFDPSFCADSILYGFARYYDFHPGGFLAGGVFASMDDGMSWKRISTVKSVTAATRFLDTLYIGAADGNLYKYAIRSKETSLLSGFGGEITAIDVKTLTKGELIIASSGGVFKSNGFGRHWHKSDYGITHPAINGVALVPIGATAERILIATRNSGIWLSDDQGEHWTWADSSIQIVPGLIQSSRQTPRIIYAGGANIWYSSDDGVRWQLCDNYPAAYYGWYGRTADLDISPYASNQIVVNYFDHSMDHYKGIVYAEGEIEINGEWRWQTRTWFDSTGNFSLKAQFDTTLYCLWISQEYWNSRDPALFGIDVRTGSKVYEIKLPDNSFSSIWHIFGNLCFLFNEKQNRLWLSSDLGKTWTSVQLNLQDYQTYDDWTVYQPLGALVYRANQEQLFLLWPGNGVLFSPDKGISWQEINVGLASRSAYQIEFSELNPPRAYLAADDGLYMTSVPTSIKEHQLNRSSESDDQWVQNYPNPFNARTTIVCCLKKAGTVKIEIYDLKGRKVKTFFGGYQQPGNYRIQLTTDDLASGLYFYRISTENGVLMRKMIKIN